MRTHRPAHRSAPCPKPESHDTGEGFTLLEVIVATGLVGLVALAVAPLMLMAVQTSAVAQETTGVDQDLAKLPPATPRIYQFAITGWSRY